MAEVHVTVSRYTVCALPADHRAYRHYAIEVVRRGTTDQWTVRWAVNWLTVDGAWVQYPPYFTDLETALCTAREAAPLIEVNGHTVQDALNNPGGWR